MNMFSSKGPKVRELITDSRKLPDHSKYSAETMQGKWGELTGVEHLGDDRLPDGVVHGHELVGFRVEELLRALENHLQFVGGLQ